MDSRMLGDNSYVNNFGYDACVCVMCFIGNGVEIVLSACCSMLTRLKGRTQKEREHDQRHCSMHKTEGEM